MVETKTVVTLYKRGLPVDKICDTINTGPGTIYYHLDKAGTELRMIEPSTLSREEKA